MIMEGLQIKMLFSIPSVIGWKGVNSQGWTESVLSDRQVAVVTVVMVTVMLIIVVNQVYQWNSGCLQRSINLFSWNIGTRLWNCKQLSFCLLGVFLGIRFQHVCKFSQAKHSMDVRSLPHLLCTVTICLHLWSSSASKKASRALPWNFNLKFHNQKDLKKIFCNCHIDQAEGIGWIWSISGCWFPKLMLYRGIWTLSVSFWRLKSRFQLKPQFFSQIVLEHVKCYLNVPKR